jgi:Zn finger protein HypA/HybF involved in hydrogenase expression
MVYRPRTKFKIARKGKRCTKCNAVIGKKGKRVRCKRCSKAVA